MEKFVEGEPRGEFVIDADAWPLVRITAQGYLGHGDFARHFGEFRSLFARERPFAIAYDTTGVTFVNWHARREYARFVRDNAEGFRTDCRGVAFIMESPLVRGALTTVLWVSPLPCPHVVLKSSDDANAWCRVRLPR